MPLDTIVPIAGAVGCIQAAIFIFLLLLKKGKTTSDRVLIAWFMIFLLSLMMILFVNHEPTRITLTLAKTLVLLHGPLLLFYAKSAFRESVSKSVLIHLLPFLLFVVTGFAIPAKYAMTYEVPLVIAKTAGLLIYPMYVWVWLDRKHSSLKNFKADDFINDSEWIKKTIVLLMGFAVLGVVHVLADVVLIVSFSVSVDIMLYVAMMTIIGFYGLRFRVVYDADTEAPDPENKAKYQTSSLSSAALKDGKRKVDQFFESSDAYLTHDFSLAQLSAKLDLPKHHLSQIINLEMNSTFYDLVNAKRIHHARSLLENRKDRSLTLEAIGYECGYNTKSAFFSQFKRIVGKTPGQYIKEISPD